MFLSILSSFALQYILGGLEKGFDSEPQRPVPDTGFIGNFVANRGLFRRMISASFEARLARIAGQTIRIKCIFP